MAPNVSTKLGTFAVRGETRVSDIARLNGLVLFEPASGVTVDDAERDDYVDRLLDILSLSNGRRITWSIRKHFPHPQRLEMVFRGSQLSTGQAFALFPTLHPGPAVKAALHNYTAQVRNERSLGVAISWSLLNAQYAEANFLGYMTALEHLIGVDTERGRGTLVDKGEFKSHLVPLLESAVSDGLLQCTSPNRDAVETVMLHRVRGLNGPSLKAGLEAYFSRYSVDVDDLSEEVAALVGMRNDIVHRGQLDGPELDRLEYLGHVARELLWRIVMTALDYRGPYYCFLSGGPQIEQFPRKHKDVDNA